MKKITVKICFGTTCFVMGSAYLQDMLETIPVKYGSKVELIPAKCLGLCSKNGEYSKAPYALINEDIIAEATAEKIIKEIEERLQNEN